MCTSALAASSNIAEQKLVLEVVGRYPILDMLKLAVKAAEIPGLKPDATRVAMALAQKIGDKPEVRELIAKVRAAKAK